jgi:hypothetical protein
MKNVRNAGRNFDSKIKDMASFDRLRHIRKDNIKTHAGEIGHEVADYVRWITMRQNDHNDKHQVPINRITTISSHDSMWCWWHRSNEVLTAVVMKTSIFWDIIPCSPLKANQIFEGTSLPSTESKEKRNKRKILWQMGFDPEDGGDMLLWNVGWLPTDHAALYPRKWYSTSIILAGTRMKQYLNILLW